MHPICSIFAIYHPGYGRTLRVMDYFLQIYLTFFFTFFRFYIFGNPKADSFKNNRTLANRGKNINNLNYTLEEVNKLFINLEINRNWIFDCSFDYNCYYYSNITIMALSECYSS